MIEFLMGNIFSMAIAIIMDLIFGDPYGFPHPVIYMGKLISALEKYFRKRFKSSKELKSAGGYIVIIVVLVTFGITYGLVKVFSFNNIALIIVNSFLLYTTLAAKCLKDEANKVYKALEEHDIKKARLRISYLVGRDTRFLDENEIVRATVETVAENTSDGVIAPLIYGIVGGAPLAMVYKAINTMDSMLGYMTKDYINIGFFPAKIDDFANYIPARVSGLFMCICAPTVRGNIFKAFRIMIRDRKNHKSPNCAYPEGAAAGAMSIRLGGTNVYFGEVIEKPTIGDLIIAIDKEHINLTNRIMIATEILVFIVCTVIIGVIAI